MISLARLFSLMKREAVLSAAAALALLSMLWVPPDGAYLSYVDWRTMAQLFCLMAVMAGLRELGVFSRLGRQLLCRVRSARQLECVLVFLCFFTSMAITNDVALLTFVPFSLEVLTLAGREERAVPVVVFQTVAANLGSMATPIGNPQNLYLYAQSGRGLGDFLALMLPHSPQTEGLMDARRLRLMKEDAILLSMGRGSVLDQEALAAVMGEGRLWGAALDLSLIHISEPTRRS